MWKILLLCMFSPRHLYEKMALLKQLQSPMHDYYKIQILKENNHLVSFNDSLFDDWNFSFETF